MAIKQPSDTHKIYDLSEQVARREPFVNWSPVQPARTWKRTRRRGRKSRRCRAKEAEKQVSQDLRAVKATSHMTKSKESLVWHLSVATAWSPVRSTILGVWQCAIFRIAMCGLRKNKNAEEKKKENCAAWCPMFSQSAGSRSFSPRPSLSSTLCTVEKVSDSLSLNWNRKFQFCTFVS